MKRRSQKQNGPQDAVTSQGPNAKAVEAIASNTPYTKGKLGRNRVLKIDLVFSAYKRALVAAEPKSKRGDGL